MERLYSSIEPEVLLHVICRKEEITGRREDFGSEKEALQVAFLNFKEGESVPAHKHLKNPRENEITQEAIIVVEGKLQATFYDMDNSLIKTFELKEGDCCVTYKGGHFFKALTPSTKMYEIKNGPYNGKEKDKDYID